MGRLGIKRYLLSMEMLVNEGISEQCRPLRGAGLGVAPPGFEHTVFC